MPIRPILNYPHPGLREKAAPVEAFDAALRALAADLVETMRAAQGIGMTASHLGIPQRLMAIALGDAEPVVYVNPVITWSSPDLARQKEGSVSMPGAVQDVERPARVTMHYQDLDGVPHSLEADGLLAVCVQHEIDQMDGIFWLQRLSKLRRDLVLRRLGKIQRVDTINAKRQAAAEAAQQDDE